MPSHRSWLRRAVPIVLMVATAIAIFVRLEQPDDIIFDETYYVNDARSYLDQGVEASFAVHPPVGKWLIAGGIAAFGDDPLGWRAAGAAAGAVTVGLTYLIGLRLFQRQGPAALAGLLVATDGLLLVQARTAMLDVFLALFTVLAAWFLLRDLDLRREADEQAAPGILPRRTNRWRLLAGVAFGLAIATKWSGGLALAAGGMTLVGFELARRRRRTGRWLADWRAGVASIAVSMVLLPVGVYALSYLPWLVNYEHTHQGRQECADAADSPDVCWVSLPGRLAGLIREHREIWNYHTTLEADHAYRAPAYTWPVMGRPVVYYWESCPEEPPADDGADPCALAPGDAAEVIAVGNPVLWYGFLLAAPLLLGGAARRDRRAAFLALFWAAQFVPWLLVSRPVFFFYMAPVVPFLALGVAYGVTAVREGRVDLRLVGGAAAGAIVGFLGGFVIERVLGASVVVRWFGLGIGYLAGAVTGAVAGTAILRLLGRDGPATPIRVGRDPGRWIGIAVALAAVAAFAYFYPVWTGLPLDYDAVRQRWWMDSWI